MKKILAYLGCVLSTWAGIWFALIADVSDKSPYDQGGLSIIAAFLFCAAILFAGWGNSLTWKGQEKKSGGKR